MGAAEVKVFFVFAVFGFGVVLSTFSAPLAAEQSHMNYGLLMQLESMA